jgi:hypothetical protein
VSSKPRDIVVPVGASSSASLSEEALLISGSGRVVKQRRLTNLSAASVKGKTLSAASALPDTNILYASLKKHQKALSTFLQRVSLLVCFVCCLCSLLCIKLTNRRSCHSCHDLS